MVGDDKNKVCSINDWPDLRVRVRTVCPVEGKGLLDQRLA